ncbi:hypothetical protein Rhe02_54190 [Rhizocola hellebori]|uniref:Uncharacterized protein n=1 Tax=Rhizocola hellebori TaxID=1392758 RepID=A0A8J3QCA9_9ACTN|nr:hypothetical protein [Rhizocola hellebori]GIH07352.1 hypothetical protein Rhe02_54190 [Rhizocola hellebori]
MAVTINGLHVLALVLLVFGVPIGMAYVGDLRQARRNPPQLMHQPPMDFEAYHFGPAHAAHIERVEADLLASLKGDSR